MTKKNYLNDFPLNEKSRQWPQFLAVISAGFLAIGSGSLNGWPAPSIPKLLAGDLGIHISDDEVSYIVMTAPLGFLVGSPLSGVLLDRIGRKNTLLLLVIPQIISWILKITCKNIIQLYVSRFVAGIGDGALFTSLPIYLGEISETKIRGMAGSSHSLGLILGLLLINIYGSYLSIQKAACCSLIIQILFIVTFVWMPESPFYLIMKNRTQEARNSLQRLRKMNNVEEELKSLTSDVQRQNSEPGSIKDIFVIKSNLKGFLTLMGLRSLQQFSGIVVLTYYAQVIFQKANHNLSPAESSIICAAVQFLVAIFGFFVVDLLGRKPIILFSAVGSGCVLIIVGLYFNFQELGYNVSSVTWIPISGMLLYTILGSLGLLMIPNVMTGELLPVSVKPKALALLSMYLGLNVSAVSKLFQWLNINFGMHVPFYTFGSVCLLGFVICYFFLIETKGKSLEEIQQILKQTKIKKSASNTKASNVP